MRHYETMFIVKATLTPEETQARIAFIKDTLTKNGATIEFCEDWGTRALAYEIEKQKRGYYYVIYFKAPPASIPELDRIYTITEDIIRHIVIKYDSKKEVEAWTQMVTKASKPREERAPREPRAETAPAVEAPVEATAEAETAGE